METWRLITTWGAAPAFNMGLDLALLGSEGAPPTLRFYSWRPAALSLGYFQRFDEVPQAREAPAVVRRPTGGGAIHHAGELTFSITAPLSHPLYQGAVGRSYERVHLAIARALSEYGVEAGLRGGGRLVSDRPGSGMCFQSSTALDLAWDGRKGCGSAQRRKGGRVLHHGSIKLVPTPLEEGAAVVDRQGVGLTAEGFAPTLRGVLERELGISLQASVPSEREREGARVLGARSASREFVHRR